MASDRPSGRSLGAWESWIDEAIRGAQSRGDFDNLAGRGKPLRLGRNPFAGDREVGFHVLKNADVMPYWMELDKELSGAMTRLETFREQAAARLERLRIRADASRVTRAAPESTGRVGAIVRWLRGPEPTAGATEPALDVAVVEEERAHARRQYLALAAMVDKQIVEDNAALPDEIRWLERPRLLPAAAARRFDGVCPPVTCVTPEVVSE